jgi:hypothetical protein
MFPSMKTVPNEVRVDCINDTPDSANNSLPSSFWSCTSPCASSITLQFPILAARGCTGAGTGCASVCGEFSSSAMFTF